MKWKEYPNSENSREPVEGLEHTKDLVQAWRIDNMAGEEFPALFSGYIEVCSTPTKNGYEQYSEESIVDFGSWELHLDTDDDSQEI